jgi:hypothetical protein
MTIFFTLVHPFRKLHTDLGQDTPSKHKLLKRGGIQMGKPKNSTQFCTQVISNKKKKIENNLEDIAKIIGVNESDPISPHPLLPHNIVIINI